MIKIIFTKMLQLINNFLKKIVKKENKLHKSKKK